MESEFVGKVALVTGAGAGIGRAIAIEWARRGGTVVVSDVDKNAADAVAAEIEKSSPAVSSLELDVRDLAQIKAVIAATVEKAGHLDVLFNVAGTNWPKNVEETEDDDWTRIIDINLNSTYRCSKYAIPEMRKRGGGAIVNIASIAGVMAEGRCAAYTASKAGVVMLTRNMAMDFAKDGIRVNAICPAGARTPRTEGYLKSVPGLEEEMLALRPMRRFCEPEEIARPAVFLASSDASYITGAALVVDGGLTAGFRIPVLERM
jgi:NAD(P)-dependent dehydrogenase (short-subunit alcohol dehydrogenase family)